MMAKSNDCTYGKVTRQIVTDMKEDVKDIKGKIDSLFDFYHNLNNHYSKRLPHWATIIITVLTSICVGCITLLLK